MDLILYTTVDQKTKDIIEQIGSIRRIQIYLEELWIKKEEYSKRMEEIEYETNKELNTINSFKKGSVYAIYQKLIGQKKEILEIAKQHYFELMLEYKELEKSIEKIDFDIQVLTQKPDTLSSLKKKLKFQLTQKTKGLGSSKLKEYKKLFQLIDQKLVLVNEIEEAIKEGSSLNRKFNTAINYIVRKAKEIYNRKKIVGFMNTYEVRNLERYQNHIVAIQHGMTKFESELNDVYAQILNTTSYDIHLEDNLMRTYRQNLIADIKNNQELGNSFMFLKNHKKNIQAIVKTLRSDLKKLKKEVAKLEKQEEALLFKISKS